MPHSGALSDCWKSLGSPLSDQLLGIEMGCPFQQRASIAHCDLNLEPKLVSAVAVIILGSASAFVARLS